MGPEQRDHDREADRYVVEDHDHATLLPDGASLARRKQEICARLSQGTSAQATIQSAGAPGRASSMR
jgi:hypothetical protein